LPPPRCVLDMVDLDSAKWADLGQPQTTAAEGIPKPAAASQSTILEAPLAAARRVAYRYEAAHLSKLERDIVRTYQTISFVNRNEADAYHRAAIPDVPQYRIGRSFAEVIASTNGVDLKHYTPTPRSLKSKTVLFTGVLDYAPNIDGLAWFVEHCLPQLRADVPDTTLRIVGKNPGVAVRRLAAQPGVQLVGPVPDTRPHLHDAAIVIAPLHVAPGVQNKVLEAMAAGRPVVATPQAASGIDATPGTHLLTAAHPTRFALLCGFLLTQPRHANQIATLARRRVEQRHRWSAALAPLVDRIVDPAAPATRTTPNAPVRLAA
ncbi:MAG: glycosyltransferase, partial [Planctomycetota bacterium]